MFHTEVVVRSKSVPTHQRQLLAIILLVVVFIAYLDRVNVSILMADNAFLLEMGIEGQAVQKGLLMTVFLAAYGVSNILLSPLGDYLGPRKAMSLAVLAWMVSLFIGGFASLFTMMLLSRAILGLGEGMHFPMQSNYIKNWFPPEERGKANSVWQVGMAIAPAIAMPLFSWLVQYTGWRASFFVLTVLGTLPLFLLWFYTTDRPRQNKRINEFELEHIEAGLREEVKNEQETGLQINTYWDNIKSFSCNYRFWLIVVYYMAHCSIIWGSMTWLPSYLKDARGFSWEMMGALASLPWILGIITKIASGYLCDKWKRRAPFPCLAMIGVAVGISLGVTVSDNLVAAIFLAMGIGSIGLGGPAAWTLMQDLVPRKGISAAAGVMNGVGNAFSALAPIIIGFLIHVTGHYASGLFYLVSCSLIAAICTFILAVQKY